MAVDKRAAAILGRPVLREADIADAAGVGSLLGELGYPCSRDEAAARIAAIGDDDTQVLVVAVHHGEVCGLVALDFMFYLPLGRETCRITALVVGEAHRHLGLGRELLRETETFARRRGAARIEVTSAEHRDGAHRFYRACGYADASLRFVRRLGDA